jgi:hypothetical protein
VFDLFRAVSSLAISWLQLPHRADDCDGYLTLAGALVTALFATSLPLLLPRLRSILDQDPLTPSVLVVVSSPLGSTSVDFSARPVSTF